MISEIKNGNAQFPLSLKIQMDSKVESKIVFICSGFIDQFMLKIRHTFLPLQKENLNCIFPLVNGDG